MLPTQSQSCNKGYKSSLPHAGQDICTQGKAADRMWIIEEGGVIALQYARRDLRYASDSGAGNLPSHHVHHHHHKSEHGGHHHHPHAPFHALGSFKSHRAVSLRALRSQSMPLSRTGRRPKSKAQAQVDASKVEPSPRLHILARGRWSNKTAQDQDQDQDSGLSAQAAAAAAAATAGTGAPVPLSLSGGGNGSTEAGQHCAVLCMLHFRAIDSGHLRDATLTCTHDLYT
jgi:hypothetical protein